MEFMSAMGGSHNDYLGLLNKPDYSDELLPSCIESVAAAMENMCLAAYDKGIASCWVEAVVRAGNALGSHFATGHGKLIGAIVLGYADMEPRPIKQKGARYVNSLSEALKAASFLWEQGNEPNALFAFLGTPQVVPAGVFLFQSDYGRENQVGHAFPTL